MRRGVLRRITRFRSIIVDYNNNAPYFCSGVSCLGTRNSAICLRTAPRVLLRRLHVNGNIEPLLLGGSSRRGLTCVATRLTRHRPCCLRTGRVLDIGGVSAFTRVTSRLTLLESVLRVWSPISTVLCLPSSRERSAADCVSGPSARSRERGTADCRDVSPHPLAR